MKDFLGKEIEVGSIVVCSGARMSGFDINVVKRLTKKRAYLYVGPFWDSFKESQNIIVITEQELIEKVLETIPNEDGFVIGYQEERIPIEYFYLTHIIKSRFFKDEEIDDYMHLMTPEMIELIRIDFPKVVEGKWPELKRIHNQLN